jgi:hypothetical protein
MAQWRIVVVGTYPEGDTLIDEFRAVVHPPLGSVSRVGTRISMTIYIEEHERHTAAQIALALWWAYLPTSRVQTFLILEMEDT